MARSFLTPINLNVNELQNFVVGRLSTTSISNLTGSDLVGGRLQYDLTTNVLKYYDGGSLSWKTIATGGSTFYIGTQQVSIGNSSGDVTSLPGVTSVNGTTIPSSATLVTTGYTGSLGLTSVGTLTSLTMGGNISLGSTNGTDGYKITGLKDPSSDYDAVNKKYVDGVAAGLNAHPAVNYATTGALGTTANLVGGTITTTYSNGTNGDGATLTIATSSNWTEIKVDGQTVTAGDRILIKNQGGTTSNLQNGLYTVTTVGAVGNTTSFVFTRAADANSTPEVAAGDITYVLAGTANGGNGFVQTATITAIGTTPIAWSQFSGSSTTTAGAGLTPNGTNPNQIDVNAAGGLSVNVSDQLIISDISPSLTTGTNFGSATAVPTIQVNSRGQITSLSSTNIGSLAASVISTGQIGSARGGTGADLSAAAAGAIPYFSSTGVMSALSAGAATQVLIGGASSPAWTNISGLSVSSAATATSSNSSVFTNDTTSAGTTFYPTFVSGSTSPAALIISSTKLSYQPSTGTLTSTVFSGSGASLTSLNATNLATGSGAVTLQAASNSNTTVTSAGTGTTTVSSAATTTITSSGTGGVAISATASGGSIVIGGLSNISTNPADNTFRGNNNSTTATTGSPRGGHLYVSGGGATGTGASSKAVGGDVYLDGGNYTTALGTFGSVQIGNNGTKDIFIGTGSVSTGVITIGNTAGSGTITLGQSSSTQTVGIATGSITTGTKTVNIGTGYGGGGTTTITIGDSTIGTTTINGTVKLPTVGTSGFVKLGSGGILSPALSTDYVASVSGTTNQISVNQTTGALTVSLPSAVTISGAMTAGSFVKSGGTGSTLLKDDGTTLATNTLVTTSSNYVTSINGSTGATSFGSSTAQSNGNLTRYYRTTCANSLSTTINHGYGQWVIVQVFDSSTGALVDVDVVNTSTSGGTTTVTFATTPALNAYTIVIIG